GRSRRTRAHIGQWRWTRMTSAGVNSTGWNLKRSQNPLQFSSPELTSYPSIILVDAERKNFFLPVSYPTLSLISQRDGRNRGIWPISVLRRPATTSVNETILLIQDHPAVESPLINWDGTKRPGFDGSSGPGKINIKGKIFSAANPRHAPRQAGTG